MLLNCTIVMAPNFLQGMFQGSIALALVTAGTISLHLILRRFFEYKSLFGWNDSVDLIYSGLVCHKVQKEDLWPKFT